MDEDCACGRPGFADCRDCEKTVCREHAYQVDVVHGVPVYSCGGCREVEYEVLTSARLER